MTERERWIVYPLLFLALGAALRDKLVDRTTTRSIVCQELSIVDEDPTGQLPTRTLVRIGGTKLTPGGKSMGSVLINGDVAVVDDDITEHSPARVVVRLGRTDPPPNVPSSGYVYVKGEVGVDGIVNSRQYTFHGIPIVPLQIAPGVPMPNVLPAMPRQAPKAPNTNVPKTKSPSQPPADNAKKGEEAAQPPSPAEEGATPAK